MDELEYLYSLRKFGMKPGLDNIRLALEKLGNVHKNLFVIQVAGTNGKGSTSSMIHRVLVDSGKKVGLFTSPHLVSFFERIRINDKLISEEETKNLIKRIRETKVSLTFFEYATLMAILHFVDNSVDIVILEVGLGGSWDATSVCDANIGVITSIALDHTNILGNTIEQIAKDKCGIIKENTKSFIGENNAALSFIKKLHPTIIVCKSYSEKVGLKGDFQKDNAGLAFSVCQYLNISDPQIKSSLERAYWPGRLEFVKDNMLVDCAHNPHAVQAVCDFVKNQKYNDLIILFGVLEDKDYNKMIRKLPKPNYLILSKPNNNRALDPVKLVYDGACAVIENPVDALKFTMKLAKREDLIFITGSIFLISEVLKELKD